MNREQWKEYRAIEAGAEAQESCANNALGDGNPRDAQVYATLAVSLRLEALSYAIRHSETPDPRYDP